METETNKPKRGRKAGTTSFASVSLASLNEFLKEGANVKISRKWAEELGFSIEESAAILSESTEAPTQPVKVEELPEEEKIAFTIS